MSKDPTPPRPTAARYDEVQNAWILSRYADVTAALRDTRLWSVDGKRKAQIDGRDDAGKLDQRGAVLEALSSARIEDWRPRVQELSQSMLESLPATGPIDVLSDFALPWGLSLAIMVTRTEAERSKLGEISGRVFAATGVSDDSALKADAAAATAELAGILQVCPIPMAEPTFVALSQTLPRLLSNAWLALAEHPDQFALLRDRPDLMPEAIEELLRYAGIVRRIFRRALAEVDLGGIHIQEGQLVALMLGSANRDPEQFPNPDGLALARPASGQLALGSGRNACVGMALIRMAVSAATAALVSTYSEMRLQAEAQWRIGSAFCFPWSVPVLLRR